MISFDQGISAAVKMSDTGDVCSCVESIQQILLEGNMRGLSYESNDLYRNSSGIRAFLSHDYLRISVHRRLWQTVVQKDTIHLKRGCFTYSTTFSSTFGP